MDYYDKNYSALEEEVKVLQQESKVVQIDQLRKVVDIGEANWLEMYDTLDRKHKKAFWKGIIKEIYIDKEKHITNVIFL